MNWPIYHFHVKMKGYEKKSICIVNPWDKSWGKMRLLSWVLYVTYAAFNQTWAETFDHSFSA